MRWLPKQTNIQAPRVQGEGGKVKDQVKKIRAGIVNMQIKMAACAGIVNMQKKMAATVKKQHDNHDNHHQLPQLPQLQNDHSMAVTILALLVVTIEYLVVVEVGVEEILQQRSPPTTYTTSVSRTRQLGRSGRATIWSLTQVTQEILLERIGLLHVLPPVNNVIFIWLEAL